MEEIDRVTEIVNAESLALPPGRNKVPGQIKQGGGLDSARGPCVWHLCVRAVSYDGLPTDLYFSAFTAKSNMDYLWNHSSVFIRYRIKHFPQITFISDA